MKQQRRVLIVLAMICTVLLCSCAHKKPPLLQDLEIRGQTKLPGQVIVYNETDVSGFSVEYGVLKLSVIKESELVLEYVDINNKLLLDRKDILVYIKVSVYNPTGKNLFVTHEVVFNEQQQSKKHDGGNTPHTTYYFYVRIPKQHESIKAKIVLQLEDSKSFVETIQLICGFKQSDERGGDEGK